jgi:hypothetical protein
LVAAGFFRVRVMGRLYGSVRRGTELSR